MQMKNNMRTSRKKTNTLEPHEIPRIYRNAGGKIEQNIKPRTPKQIKNNTND